MPAIKYRSKRWEGSVFGIFLERQPQNRRKYCILSVYQVILIYLDRVCTIGIVPQQIWFNKWVCFGLWLRYVIWFTDNDIFFSIFLTIVFFAWPCFDLLTIVSFAWLECRLKMCSLWFMIKVLRLKITVFRLRFAVDRLTQPSGSYDMVWWIFQLAVDS